MLLTWRMMNILWRYNSTRRIRHRTLSFSQQTHQSYLVLERLKLKIGFTSCLQPKVIRRLKYSMDWAAQFLPKISSFKLSKITSFILNFTLMPRTWQPAFTHAWLGWQILKDSSLYTRLFSKKIVKTHFLKRINKIIWDRLKSSQKLSFNWSQKMDSF